MLSPRQSVVVSILHYDIVACVARIADNSSI
jgi:hypothetical protein